MGHLEAAIRHVLVADEAQAIGPDGHGGKLADFPYAIE